MDIARTSLRVGRGLALVASCVLLGAQPAAAGVPGWTGPTTVAPGPFEAPALDVGPDGRVYLAYERFQSTRGIFFATTGRGAWTRQRVSTGIDRQPSVAVDGSLAAHVVFSRWVEECDPSGCTGESTGIFHATNATDAWSVTRLTTGRHEDPVIDIDSSGKLYVAALAPAGIRYLTNRTGAWVRTTIPVDFPSGVDMVVDPSDGVHLVWEDGPSGIDYASSYDDFMVETVESEGQSAYPAIDADAGGTPHVVYNLPAVGGDVYYRQRSFVDGWSAPVEVDGARHGRLPDIALDEADFANVTYQRENSTGAFDGVMFATNVTGTWARTRLTTGPYDWLPVIDVDRSGRPRVAFQRREDGVELMRKA